MTNFEFKKMTRNFLLVVICTFVFTSCNNGKDEKIEDKQAADTSAAGEIKATDVPFIVAKNYFVKNTVKQVGLENPKIETKENFDALFGAATTMGKNGKPTEINFSKQYVIAVVGDETDIATEISPVSLQKDDKNRVTLNYKTTKGSKQSFKIRPALIVIVDRNYEGPISIKEQSN